MAIFKEKTPENNDKILTNSSQSPQLKSRFEKLQALINENNWNPRTATAENNTPHVNSRQKLISQSKSRNINNLQYKSESIKSHPLIKNKLNLKNRIFQKIQEKHTEKLQKPAEKLNLVQYLQINSPKIQGELILKNNKMIKHYSGSNIWKFKGKPNNNYQNNYYQHNFSIVNINSARKNENQIFLSEIYNRKRSLNENSNHVQIGNFISRNIFKKMKKNYIGNNISGIENMRKKEIIKIPIQNISFI